MDLHAQFDQRVLLHGADLRWVDSPVAGVQRRMLDRIGGEVARATSIVRYAPGSHFSPHTTVVKSSWCLTACSRTSTGTTLQAATSATRPPPVTRQAQRPVA